MLDAFGFLVVVIFALYSVPLDLRQRRIPNSMLVTLFFCEFVIVVVSGKLGKALVGGSAIFLVYLFVHTWSKKAIGAGDVKLVAVLGFGLAFTTLRESIIWTFSLWSFGAIHAVGAMVFRRSLRISIAFAPAIFLGTLTYLAAPIWSSLPQ